MNCYYPISEYLGTNTITFRCYKYPISESGEHHYNHASDITEHVLVLPDGSYNVEELQNKIKIQSIKDDLIKKITNQNDINNLLVNLI